MLKFSTHGSTVLRSGLAALLLAMVSMQSASAYTFLPPECTEGTKACIESGKLSYVSVYGPIRGQDEEMFREIDYLLSKDASFPLVYVNSPGGRSYPAMAIGRILRKRSAEVRSGSPLFPENKPECSSACTLLAAGAPRRYLSHVGVHSGHFRESTGCGTWKKVALDEAAEKEEADYLRDMGMPVILEKTSRKTAFDKMTDFFLDPRKPIKGQMITTLGFFTGGADDLKRIPAQAFDSGAQLASRLEYLRNSAEKGPSDAAWAFIEFLNTAEPAEYRNPELAFTWLRRLVDRGDGYARYILGNYYAEGIGTSKNPGEALRNYVQAAEQGVGQAQAIVGRAYLRGDGLPQDDLAAFEFSLRAAERGQPMAYETLCEFYGRRQSGEPSRRQGATWCRLAATSTKNLSIMKNLEKIQDDLARDLASEDLQKVQDLAINWRPLEAVSKESCAIGGERF